MKLVRVKNPTISAYQLDKVGGRGNFQNFLLSKGVIEWNYSWSLNELNIWVADYFDTTVLNTFGVVEVEYIDG